MLSCPRQVMLGQLDRLLSMDLENVTLGIIPMGRELRMTLYNGFLMLDDVLVTESYGYEDQGTDQAEAHARIFELLMDESATGEDARRLIVAAAASLRQELGNGVQGCTSSLSRTTPPSRTIQLPLTSSVAASKPTGD
jgi:hypothetical protein